MNINDNGHMLLLMTCKLSVFAILSVQNIKILTASTCWTASVIKHVSKLTESQTNSATSWFSRFWGHCGCRSRTCGTKEETFQHEAISLVWRPKSCFGALEKFQSVRTWQPLNQSRNQPISGWATKRWILLNAISKHSKRLK